MLRRKQVWTKGSYPLASCPSTEVPILQEDWYLQLSPAIQKKMDNFLNINLLSYSCRCLVPNPFLNSVLRQSHCFRIPSIYLHLADVVCWVIPPQEASIVGITSLARIRPRIAPCHTFSIERFLSSHAAFRLCESDLDEVSLVLTTRQFQYAHAWWLTTLHMDTNAFYEVFKLLSSENSNQTLRKVSYFNSLNLFYKYYTIFFKFCKDF